MMSFPRKSSRSWALASRVYDHVEKTQKDVLFGVLFYIALFVPFAFCLERLLFGFVSIYKRIAGFTAILLLLIVIIAQVHPAFELAYSPTVVILAFFIIGLSFLVTMIIILRFEDEMILLQTTDFPQTARRNQQLEGLYGRIFPRRLQPPAPPAAYRPHLPDPYHPYLHHHELYHRQVHAPAEPAAVCRHLALPGTADEKYRLE